jgi:hypothetical protein
MARTVGALGTKTVVKVLAECKAKKRRVPDAVKALAVARGLVPKNRYSK